MGCGGVSVLNAVEQARGELPALIASDAVNLADERLPCPDKACNLACVTCHGRGYVVAPTGREHLSFSSLSTLLNCEQKYGYAHDARLEPVARRAPLELGAAYQKALELGDPSFAPHYLREHATIRTQDEENRTQIEETVVESAASLYLATWGQPEVSEFEYRVRLRSPWTGHYSKTFDLLGYADGLEDRGSWHELVENKLVGQITATSVRKLPLDRQLSLSRYGIWRATGKPVREVRYRFMRKPSIKQKKDEALVEFCDRVRADYLARPEFYAQEEHLLVGEDDLVRIEAELWTWAEQLRRARRDRIWARNTSMCHEYGGCAFLAACLGDPDAASLYQVRPERPVVAPAA